MNDNGEKKKIVKHDKHIKHNKHTITIDIIINNYIRKICEYDNLNKSFDEKLNNIIYLTDNLIDYCIKKKIFYFIENKINYTGIVTNFKSHLVNFIKELVDPNNTIINKYIINTQDDNISLRQMGWDNVSDLNSIMFKNFKNLNETFEKNVSFGLPELNKNFQKDSRIEITNYDEIYDGFELNKIENNFTNKDNYNDNDNDNYKMTNEINEKILPIYIKLIINQNKHLVEFIDKLTLMCNILSDIDIKYKKNNPYN